MKRIAVIGAGPVGGVLAAHLIRGGIQATVIDNSPDYRAAIRKNGIVVTGFARLSAPVESMFGGLAEAASAGCRFDLAFVCVKATVNVQIARNLPAVLGSSGVAVSLQNGLDTEAVLAGAVGWGRTLRGVVNYAGNMAGHEIRMTFFNPPNHIGPADGHTPALEETARSIAGMLTAAGLATEYNVQVQREVWAKSIRNAAMTPVSAIAGMTIAEVMGFSRSRFLVERLLEEGMAVAGGMGFAFDRRFFDETIDYFERAGHHTPSMRADLLARRLTEVEFLNNKIAEHGERLGVPTPFQRAIANLVLCLDEMATR